MLPLSRRERDSLPRPQTTCGTVFDQLQGTSSRVDEVDLRLHPFPMSASVIVHACGFLTIKPDPALDAKRYC